MTNYKTVYPEEALKIEIKWSKPHPHIKLYVSVGIINQSKIPGRKLINDVEKLLIYSHKNDDHKYMINKKATLNHHVKANYQIINSAFLDDGMLKEIYYGLFFK